MKIQKKVCTKCNKEKNLKKFHNDKQKSDGLYSSCKECTNEERRGPEHRISRQKHQLSSKYGLTLDEYDEMLKKQNGRCAICGGLNKSGYKLGVDHNHETGKIRKLLCASCNVIIGVCYEDINILKLVIKYLEENNG